MRAKLFKIFPKRINNPYDDYYGEVEKLTVSNYSDWEEFDEQELWKLRDWCCDNKNYILIEEIENGFSKVCINEQIKAEEKRKELQKQINLKNRERDWIRKNLLKPKRN